MTGALRRALQFSAAIATVIVLGVVLVAPAAAKPPPALNFPDAQLEMLGWRQVDGWNEDNLSAAFATFRKSCTKLLPAKARRHRPAAQEAGDPRPMRRALAHVCARAAKARVSGDAAARRFFERNFRPVRIAPLGQETGFLTGYYEPIVEGSLFPSETYHVPLYAPPPDLVTAAPRTATGEFPNRAPVGRRTATGDIVPYYDRAEIEDGALAGRGLEICWLKDPVDAFFVQIQGSARVKLDSGKTLRINYAAHNGLPYTPVGRLLIERGLVPRADMSMHRIRQWMNDNPTQGAALRRENRSYVFMRVTGLSDNDEAVGAEGVPLTPRRSIAVDARLHVYGTPFFISADLPIESEAPVTPFRHLMIAQDTGSAIVGPARADIYFGAGTGAIAGRLKQPGIFVMLVPREIDPARARAPLPRRRPATPEMRVSSADTPLPQPRPSGATAAER